VPYLARINIYPFKALDALSVDSAHILAGGALEHDRTFALLDEQGKFVNGKRYPKVHSLRARFDMLEKTLALRIQGAEEEYIFQLDAEREELANWLCVYFGSPVTLVENTVSGFPDDTVASGPTVISTATLETVASWFPGQDVQTIRQRFRANLEIGGVPPFWEDRLFTTAEAVVPFRIGAVLFEGTNPCQRCVVPSRDPQTGAVWPHFQATFMHQRRESLPEWATLSRFNHFYRLSCNTRVPASEAGKQLQVGDPVNVA
jgi:uncharacterized protein